MRPDRNDVTAPFDSFAENYDRDFTGSIVGRAQREVVWRHVAPLVGLGARVLDLGCGTGEDALWLARKGAEVTALDASGEMIRIAERKVEEAGLSRSVRFLELPIERLREVVPDLSKIPFDLALSNFSALNCLADLSPLGDSLGRLVRFRGRFVAVVFAPFCAFEIGWNLARFRPRKAFRRLRSAGSADIDGRSLPIRYAGAGRIARELGSSFRLVDRVGVGLLVPPSSAEPLARRAPALVRAAARLERPLLRLAAPFADHMLLDFERIAPAGASGR